MNPRLKMRGSLSAAVTLLTIAVGWSMIQSQASTVRADASEATAKQALSQVTTLNGKVDANGQALAEANGRLIALGKAPVPVPSPPAPPEPQPQGLTASQLEAVRAVVVDVLDSHNAKVSQATINQITTTAAHLATANIQAGLPAAVQAVVTAYCTDDKCVGPVGPVGPAGRAGSKGDAGKDAPAVTDEQLLASAQQALATYCGQDSKPCQGPKGDKGDKGDTGDTGPFGPACPAGFEPTQQVVLTRDQPSGILMTVCTLADK